MEKGLIRQYIAARVAKEFHNGDIVNLGIGLPTLVPAYLPEGVHVILQSENGIIGTSAVTEENCAPLYVVDAGGKPAAVARGGCFVDSSQSFGLIRGGHVDATVLGALQVDEHGNLSNWIVPGKMVPGMGGAMDLVVGARKVIVAMEHTQKGVPKILRQCTLPVTAVGVVTMIITEMGVIQVTEDGLVLAEINPEYTPEQVIEATEASLIISPEIQHIA